MRGCENKNQGAKKEAREETPAARRGGGGATVFFFLSFFFNTLFFFLSRWGMRAVHSEYRSRGQTCPRDKNHET